MALRYFCYYHAMKYPHKNLQNFIEENHFTKALQCLNFKKVKHKAIVALQMWIDGKWKFELIETIPTPYEVLRAQAQGIRPVSLIVQKSFRPILSRQDCLEFFLHDLEHGYMFFNNTELFNMQVTFFNKILSTLSQGLWDELMEVPGLKEKFYYLISDMNTHQEHYRHYLRAILPKNKIDEIDHLIFGELRKESSID